MDPFYNSVQTKQSPIVTRPNRTLHFGQFDDSSKNNASFQSPFSFFTKNTSQQSKSNNGGTISMPRSPVVHCFVCDHGNAKVKILTDQFIECLIKNGIKVYIERYLTHQPGYQVRAASLHSPADFFFQIHSKTSVAGHVRLYMAGQPKRMSKEEAISVVWSYWRLKCGALTQEETELLSKEKILQLIKEFAHIDTNNIDITSLQQKGRELIDRGQSARPVLTALNEAINLLKNGKDQVNAAVTMSTEWKFEPGVVLQKCVPVPITAGLSQPLRLLLNSVLDQTIYKAQAVANVLERYYIASPEGGNLRALEDETIAEIPIDNEQRVGDGSSWQMMIESVDEDRIGSVQIASYGDGQAIQSFDRITMPVFMLDDF